jgi:hypothetical protein
MKMGTLFKSEADPQLYMVPLLLRSQIAMEEATAAISQETCRYKSFNTFVE